MKLDVITGGKTKTQRTNRRKKRRKECRVREESLFSDGSLGKHPTVTISHSEDDSGPMLEKLMAPKCPAPAVDKT